MPGRILTSGRGGFQPGGRPRPRGQLGPVGEVPPQQLPAFAPLNMAMMHKTQRAVLVIPPSVVEVKGDVELVPMSVALAREFVKLQEGLGKGQPGTILLTAKPDCDPPPVYHIQRGCNNCDHMEDMSCQDDGPQPECSKRGGRSVDPEGVCGWYAGDKIEQEYEEEDQEHGAEEEQDGPAGVEGKGGQEPGGGQGEVQERLGEGVREEEKGEGGEG